MVFPVRRTKLLERRSGVLSSYSLLDGQRDIYTPCPPVPPTPRGSPRRGPAGRSPGRAAAPAAEGVPHPAGEQPERLDPAVGCWAWSLCHPKCPQPPIPGGAVALVATGTALTPPPPRPPAPSQLRGGSPNPQVPRWGRWPGVSPPLTSLAGSAARAVAAEGDGGRGQGLSSAPHPAALCPLVKAGEGRRRHERLARPPPPQSAWPRHPQGVLAPGHPAGSAARAVPSPRSPAPGLGVGDVPPGTTQPWHPQDSVPARGVIPASPKLPLPGKCSRGGWYRGRGRIRAESPGFGCRMAAGSHRPQNRGVSLAGGTRGGRGSCLWGWSDPLNHLSRHGVVRFGFVLSPLDSPVQLRR